VGLKLWLKFAMFWQLRTLRNVVLTEAIKIFFELTKEDFSKELELKYFRA